MYRWVLVIRMVTNIILGYSITAVTYHNSSILQSCHVYIVFSQLLWNSGPCGIYNQRRHFSKKAYLPSRKTVENTLIWDSNHGSLFWYIFCTSRSILDWPTFLNGAFPWHCFWVGIRDFTMVTSHNILDISGRGFREGWCNHQFIGCVWEHYNCSRLGNHGNILIPHNGWGSCGWAECQQIRWSLVHCQVNICNLILPSGCLMLKKSSIPRVI